MMKLTLKLFVCWMLCIYGFMSPEVWLLSFAQSPSTTAKTLHIIPENSESDEKQVKQDVKDVANRTKGTVIDTYNEIASGYESRGEIGKAMQSGIMGWNTPIQYVVYAMSFLSQLGLLIGGLMILYAGYLYGSTVFSGSNPTKAKSAIRNAIIGVLVVVFSFAIWKGLVSSFL